LEPATKARRNRDRKEIRPSAHSTTERDNRRLYMSEILSLSWVLPTFDACFALVEVLIVSGLQSPHVRDCVLPLLQPLIQAEPAPLGYPPDTWHDNHDWWPAAQQVLAGITAAIGFYAESALALIGASGSGAKGAEYKHRLSVATRTLGRKDKRYFKKTVVPAIADQIATEMLHALQTHRSSLTA